MANATGATVIFLHSHPAWFAAEQRAHQRSEAMLRHPSSRSRQRAAAGGDRDRGVRALRLCPSADTPA